MKDLIERQAAIDALAKHEKSNGHNYTLFIDIVSECAEIIRDLPSAQPERKRGKWIMDMDRHSFLCSMCGAWQKYNRNYCPNCGADMREDDHG